MHLKTAKHTAACQILESLNTVEYISHKVRSDQSPRCPHEETLHPWLSKARPGKILIRLRERAG